MTFNRTFVAVLLIALVVSVCSPVMMKSPVLAAEQETIVGTVVKTDKGFIIEAEDGDYLVKGKDLSKMAGKLIEATGIITESEKGDSIDVKSFEEIKE